MYNNKPFMNNLLIEMILFSTIISKKKIELCVIGVVEYTSCWTPPTLMLTRRLRALLRMIMNGSGGSDVIERE